MHNKLKLIHHKHTGRLRPHEHTSYLPLAFLLLVVGVIMGIISFSNYAQASPGPSGGSIGLNGTLPTNPPKIAATITTPKNGQHFSTIPITVAGTCTNGMLVEIYKNKIFAGSANCDNSGHFSLKIDLLYGKNVLTAQILDVLNQAGPTSAPVTVYYDIQPPAPAPSSLLNLTGNQLLLETDAVYRGSFPGQTLNVPITIIGGTPPFAINVDWGDSTNSVIPRGNNSVFNAHHVYQKPGTYKIIIQGSDSKGLVAFLQVAAIINGQPSVIASTSTPTATPNNRLLTLWPLFAIAATMVISFWLGEKREKRLLTKLNQSQNPPLMGVAPQPPA